MNDIRDHPLKTLAFFRGEASKICLICLICRQIVVKKLLTGEGQGSKIVKIFRRLEWMVPKLQSNAKLYITSIIDSEKKLLTTAIHQVVSLVITPTNVVNKSKKIKAVQIRHLLSYDFKERGDRKQTLFILPQFFCYFLNKGNKIL